MNDRLTLILSTVEDIYITHQKFTYLNLRAGHPAQNSTTLEHPVAESR